MPDTIRTVPELLTIFADGQPTGAITPQDMRDFVVTTESLASAGGGLTTEDVDDRVAALLTEGANVTLTYNDVAGTLSIAAAGAGGGTVFDVSAYGAVGDGVTDDRAAIMAAIAAADAAGGGEVWFPPGIYIVSFASGTRSGILMTNCSNIHFHGAGIGVTVIKQEGGNYGSNDFMLFNLDSENYNIIWSEMTLDGNKANVTSNDDQSHLIDVSEPATDIKMFNVHFKDAAGDGVRLIGVSGAYGVERVTTAFCRFTDARRGGWVMQRGARIAVCAFNYFSGTSDQDVSAETTGGGSAPSHVLVQGNIIEHDSSSNVAIAVAGDSPSYCKDWSFVDNILLNVDMDFLRCQDFLIQGNFHHMKRGTPTLFIHGGEARNIRILDNEYLTDTTNLPASSGVIKIEADSGAIPSGIAIRGNEIRVVQTNATPAIRIAAHEAEITNNTLRGSAVSASRGILFPNPAINVSRKGIRIEGNTISDFDTAIRVDGDSNDLIAGLRITGNRGYTDCVLLSDPNLAIGTVSAAKIKYDAFTCRILGVLHSVAAGEVAFTATKHDIADPDAAAREAVYVVSVGADEVATITKGADATAAAGVAPATPYGHVKMGELRLQHNGSAIFDATTDLLSAAHLTDVYTDSTIGVVMTTGITFNGNLDTILDSADGHPVIYGNDFDDLVTGPLTGLGTATFMLGGNQGSAVWLSGSGVPSLTAAVGSMYTNRAGGAGTAFYVNTNGSTTWAAVA